jgi:hypothetical protein
MIGNPVLIVDDHDFVRAQLVTLLGACADIRVQYQPAWR